MEKKTGWRKALKIIGMILLSLLLLLVVAVVGIFVTDKVLDHQEWEKLEQAGYVNRVSIGSHQLNVCMRGDENAKYTIVSLQGLNAMANAVELEPLMDRVKDCRFVLVDRSGYGMSEDTGEAQTVEQVVSDYRTALKNSGISAPYILMGHSFGGVYESYWQQHYPEEIKAAIYLDPTQIGSLDTVGEDMQSRHADFGMHLETLCVKLGFDRLVFDPAQYIVDLPEKQQEYATILWRCSARSWAVCSEEDCYFENVKKTFDSLSPNQIPKLYIDAGKYTREDVIADMDYAKQIRKKAGLPAPEYDISEDMVDDQFVQELKNFFETNIKAYMEKLGNVTYRNIPGDHSIFKHKPDEVAEAVNEFLGTLA